MKNRKKETIGGIFLIGIGILVLIAQFGQLTNLGMLFLPALGALFLVWGILTREGGLMIPGGILSGIGWGAYAISGPYADGGGSAEGGIFLVIFGLGFALITLLTALFTEETHWWALIPGGILATIGVAIMTNGVLLDVVQLVGKYWPLTLIALGLYVIYKAMKGQEPEEKYVEEKRA
ncbi:MAG: hypothetical protein HND44_19120 [Chloroflexi bacterium]|nr:hypothetical protein [Ardenticatenaceae bacterium]MBL1130568.1 hypothetical protein [Chloroflexota bacterium]NOG36658.1 hypothetical protein [Chloroflexota bacterium]GIK57123.1 MAG: hypothetical protein BroJett015_27860 [Chloroflexota bacterium]